MLLLPSYRWQHLHNEKHPFALFLLNLFENSLKGETRWMHMELLHRLHNLNNRNSLCGDAAGCAPFWASRKPPPEPTGESKEAWPPGVTEM